MLEVYQAKRLIKSEELLSEYPILATPMNCKTAIYLENELFSEYTTNTTLSLLENIILSAKKAAFETDSSKILTSTQYLHAEVELTLYTADGAISEKDRAILEENETALFD